MNQVCSRCLVRFSNSISLLRDCWLVWPTIFDLFYGRASESIRFFWFFFSSTHFWAINSYAVGASDSYYFQRKNSFVLTTSKSNRVLNNWNECNDRQSDQPIFQSSRYSLCFCACRTICFYKNVKLWRNTFHFFRSRFLAKLKSIAFLRRSMDFSRNTSSLVCILKENSIPSAIDFFCFTGRELDCVTSSVSVFIWILESLHFALFSFFRFQFSL